jgi:hypothetical protein
MDTDRLDDVKFLIGQVSILKDIFFKNFKHIWLILNKTNEIGAV